MIGNNYKKLEQSVPTVDELNFLVKLHFYCTALAKLETLRK